MVEGRVKRDKKVQIGTRAQRRKNYVFLISGHRIWNSQTKKYATFGSYLEYID